jgi:TonB family protein
MKPALSLLQCVFLSACLSGAQQANSGSTAASVSPGDPIHVVDAKYPKKARKEKIEGPVTLHLIVATDGAVKEVSVLKGDPELIGAATDAVRKWRFQPFVRDGKSVDGERDVTIRFALAKDSSAAASACDSSIGPVYKVGDNGVSPPKLVTYRDPEYSEAARQNRLQGVVTLSLVVGPGGQTCDVRITRSLDRELDEKAIEAVRTWRFKPAVKDGQPVAATLNVETQFHLY